MKILMIGGTGNIGAEVVKELQKRNADIRLLIRKEGDRTPKGVEVAIGDLLEPVSVQKALHGVDKLYLLNAVAPDELTRGLIAYDLAKRLKLKHIVYHSVFRVDTSRMFHTLPRSWLSKTLCGSSMSRSRLSGQTTLARTTQR
jgi:uncharacterized protein YbjT (DUF2867 family)